MRFLYAKIHFGLSVGADDLGGHFKEDFWGTLNVDTDGFVIDLPDSAHSFSLGGEWDNSLDL